jgi:hypothetical protein
MSTLLSCDGIILELARRAHSAATGQSKSVAASSNFRRQGVGCTAGRPRTVRSWLLPAVRNNQFIQHGFFSYEFGGPVGVSAMIVGFPIMMYYFWICLRFYDGALVHPGSFGDLGAFFHRMWAHVCEVRLSRCAIFCVRNEAETFYRMRPLLHVLWSFTLA